MILLAVAILIVLLLLSRKNNNVNRCFVIVLGAVGILIGSVAAWFYTPTSCHIPDNPVYQKRYGSYEWIDDEDEREQLTDILESLELQRNSIPSQGLIPTDKAIPGGIDPDMWMVIAIHDGDAIEHGSPKLWGYCSILLSHPYASRIVYVNEGLFGDYEILNVDTYIDLLSKIK